MDLSKLKDYFIQVIGEFGASCIHQLGACHVGVQLTLVSTSQLVHQLGTPVGTTHQSLISFQVAQSNNTISPSCIIYSFPSSLTRPFSFAAV